MCTDLSSTRSTSQLRPTGSGCGSQRMWSLTPSNCLSRLKPGQWSVTVDSQLAADVPYILLTQFYWNSGSIWVRRGSISESRMSMWTVTAPVRQVWGILLRLDPPLYVFKPISFYARGAGNGLYLVARASCWRNTLSKAQTIDFRLCYFNVSLYLNVSIQPKLLSFSLCL